MARTRGQIEDDALQEFGFKKTQSPRLDAQVEKAFIEVIRILTNTAWQWNRVSQEEFAMTQSQATITMPKYVGKVDEQTLRRRKGTGTRVDMNYVNPVEFDRLVSDPTKEGTPVWITTAEHTEERIFRVSPVPNATDFKLVASYHRNLEFTSAGVQLADADSIVAPEHFEDLMIAHIKKRLAPIIFGAKDPENVALQLELNKKIGELNNQLATVDPIVNVEPPGDVIFFDEGITLE